MNTSNHTQTVVCDLDGTLTTGGQVNQPILSLLEGLDLKYYIVLLTARSEAQREQTRKWLAEHCPSLQYDELRFRPGSYGGSHADFKIDVLKELESGMLPLRIALVLENDGTNARKIGEAGYPTLLFGGGAR